MSLLRSRVSSRALSALFGPALAAAFAAALFSMPLAAQVGRSGLLGTAVDEQGQPVSGLAIVLEPVGGTASGNQNLQTDRRGRFVNRFLPSGNYILEVRDRDRFFIKEAKIEVRDSGGIVLLNYEITNHPKETMSPIPIRGAQITHVDLVVTGAEYRENLLRQLEGSAVQGEMADLVRLYNDHEFEQALALGQQLIAQMSTELPELLHVVGMIYAGLDRFGEAEPLLRRATEISPGDAEFRASLGTMLLDVARQKEPESEAAKAAYQEAEASLAMAIAAISTPSPGLLINHAIALEGAGKQEAAVEVLERVSDADPDNIVVRLRLAALLRSLGRLNEAMEILATLPGSGDPRAVDSLYNVGLTFFNDEDYDSARAALEHAVKINPEHALSQRLLARVYVVQEKPAMAIPHLRRFLELEPDHPEADMEREWLAYLEKTASK